MGPRTTRMRLCGAAFDSEDAAGDSRRGRMTGARVERCPDKTCGKWHVRGGDAWPGLVVLQGPRRATGFPARVKLLVRTRSGLGEIEDACCESCGLHLGRYGGQVQHIIARGMGGTTRPVLGTAANGALLCGLTPQDGCHGAAESRDAGMRARGFWLEQGSDPALEPMALHTGAVVWRSEDGSYLFEAPEARAACSLRVW
jgi:hypothetical protein